MRHPIAVVFRKEVRDNLRDRRSLVSALIYPMLGPLVFALLLAFVGGVVGAKRAQTEIILAVAGLEHAPALVARLADNHYKVVAAPPDISTAVRTGRVPLVLEISPGLERRLDEGGRGSLTLVTDNARLDVVMATGQLVEVLRGYAREHADQRLARLGLSAELIEPVAINNVIVSKPLKVAELILLMVPAFVMFTLFIGGVYLAIDSIAGERERGSFEPLMANPVPRWNFLAGKALAAGLFTLAAVVLQMAAFLWVLEPFDHLFVSGARFDAAKALAALPMLPPMLALAVAVQMLVAIMTRSFKEAQTWLGLLPLVPATPGMILAMVPIDVNGWATFVPLLSQTVAMQEMIRGTAVPMSHHLIGAVVTSALAAALFWFAARRMEREDVVFGAGG